MTASLAPIPKFRAFTKTGSLPLAFGTLETFAANSSTPQTTYKDSAGVVPNLNPVVLDSFGEADVWLGPLPYKLQLKNAAGEVQWTMDNVQSAEGVVVDLNSALQAMFANTASADHGDALLGVKQPFTGAIAHTQHLKNQDRVTFWDFMTDAQIADAQAGTLLIDCSAAISAAIAVAIAICGVVYGPPGKYRCDSSLSFTSSRGLVIEGAGGSLTVTGGSVTMDTVLSFDSAPAGSDGLVCSGFTGLTMRNLYISQNRNALGGGTALWLHSGHDFVLENIKVDDNTGTTGCGIKLGEVIAKSVFVGSIKNCKVISHGKSFWSGKANTSLTFLSCYSIGGTYWIDGTVYSSFISCASDSSAAGHGYTITGNSDFNSSNLTFVGCGTEGNHYAGFSIDGHSNNLTFLNPYGADNNKAGLTTVGDLFYIDSTSGRVTGITITSPSALLVNANTFANISVTYDGVTPENSTGTLAVHGFFSAVMPKGIKAHTTPDTVSWASEFLTQFGDTQHVPRLEVSSQFAPFRMYSRASGGGLYSSFTEELMTVLAGVSTDVTLGQGNPDLTIYAKNRILGWSFRVDTLLASSDGGTTFSIIAQSGFAAPVTLVSGLQFTKNTKWVTMASGLAADQLTSGTVALRIQCDGGKSFVAGGQVRAIVYRERVLDMDDAI